MLRLVPILAILGCATPFELSTESTDLKTDLDGGVVYPSYTNFCRRVTVTGSVYFNDLRENGRFELRDADPDQIQSYEPWSDDPPGSEPYGTGDDWNYRALLDAQVDIYEADVAYGNGASCFATQLQGTTNVLADGTFAWTGDVCETCAADLDGGQDEDLSIAAKISLRNCSDPSERCFSVAAPTGDGGNNHYDDAWGGTTYIRWFDGATNTSPKRIGGTNATLGSDRFETVVPVDTAAIDGDEAMQAANLFASMVDVTRKVHFQGGVPFGKPEVKLYYPQTTGTHSHESGRICVAAGDWVDGWAAPHEYGHLVHFWAWDGHGKWVSYCFDDNHDGVQQDWECAESGQEEYANAAFKEGWASFIAAATLTNTGSLGCDALDDYRTTACPDGVCTTSRHYIEDVMVALCDVWDADNECRQRGNGVYCDNDTLSLLEMWNGLERVWDHATDDQRETVEDATQSHPAILTTFGVCTLAEELDAGNHLSSTIAAAGLDCGL